MRILVTGPAGQIGWELMRALPALGETIGADRSVMDLGDLASIRKAIAELKPDVIVNAAGYTAVDRAESEPELVHAINGSAVGALAEEAARRGAALVHFSTDYVFDGAKRTPYAPDDEPNPINAYGASKLAGERAIGDATPDHLILRTSWVYSRRRQNFLLTMLRLAQTEPELRVVDDQFGCPSWSRLIARGAADILAAAVKNNSDGWSFGAHAGIHHLACGGVTTWRRLAEHILASADIDDPPSVIPIETDDYPTAARRPAYSALDCTRTRERFGVDLGDWRPAVVAALNDDELAAGTKAAANSTGKRP